MTVMFAGVLGFPSVASAHDPIIIDDGQTSPEAGPLLLDGTISFALYGRIGGPGDTRGFRVRMAEGTRLSLELLIPDLAPENELPVESLPRITVEAPDGSVTEATPDIRVAFDEPFSRTSYVRLLRVDEPATSGDYSVTISGTGASRFTVAVGTLERFGTPVENVVDRNAGVPAVIEWYETPPPPSSATTTPGDRAPETTDPDEMSPEDRRPVAALAMGVVALAAGVAVLLVRRRRASEGGSRGRSAGV